MVPLCTTASSFPWYHTLSPITLQLPPRAPPSAQASIPGKQMYYTYRYAIHRAGVFHRWEKPSDGPTDMGDKSTTADKQSVVPGDDDVNMSDHFTYQHNTEQDVLCHEVPLRLLASRESYFPMSKPWKEVSWASSWELSVGVTLTCGSWEFH